MLEVATEELKSALADLQEFVPKKGSLSVTRYVRLTGTVLEGTDLDTWVERRIDATEEFEPSPDPVFFPFDLLRRIVASTRVSMCKIGWDEDMKHPFFKGGAVEVHLEKSISPDEFPPKPDFPNNETIQLDLSNLRLVAHSIADEDSRPVLHTLNVKYSQEHESVMAAAADGFRLTIAPVKGDWFTTYNEKPSLLIPRRVVRGILHHDLSDVGVQVHQAAERPMFNSMKIKLSLPRVTYVTLGVQGQFPNYEQLIPGESDGVYDVEVSALKTAIDGIIPIANEGSRIIRFEFEEEELTIRSYAEAVGEARATILSVSKKPLPKSNQGKRIAFNAKYLRSLVDTLPEDVVEIGLTTSSSPAVFRSGDHTEVIMPMFVQW